MTGGGNTARALPVLLALGATWGASFLFIKIVVDDTGPMELVAGRLFFGMLAVAAYMLAIRRPLRVTPVLIGQVSIMAMFSNIVPFALIAWGEEHIGSGTTSILNATMPIFTAVFAAAVLNEEHFTPARFGGLLLGFAGVAVLTGDGLTDVTDSSVLGEFAVVGAAACYAGGAVFARNLLRDQDPLNFAMLQLLLGTAYAIPIMLAVRGGSPDTGISPEAWACLILLGIGGTGLGYVAYLWLIENIGSVRASLVTYILPVVAVFLGWLVLDERIGVNTIAGGLLIIAGVASVMRGQAPSRQREPAGVPAAVGE